MCVVKVNVPVEIESEDYVNTVTPEDYIVGDMNGVVCIPKTLLNKVLPLLKAGAEADGSIASAIKLGSSFAEASKKYRCKS